MFVTIAWLHLERFRAFFLPTQNNEKCMTCEEREKCSDLASKEHTSLPHTMIVSMFSLLCLAQLQNSAIQYIKKMPNAIDINQNRLEFICGLHIHINLTMPTSGGYHRTSYIALYHERSS